MDQGALLFLPGPLLHLRRGQGRQGGRRRASRRAIGALPPHGRAWRQVHPVPLPPEAHEPSAEARRRTRRGQVGADIVGSGARRDRRKAPGHQGRVRPRGARRVGRHLPFRPPMGAHALHQPVRQPRQHHRPRHDLLVLDVHAQHGHARVAGGDDDPADGFGGQHGGRVGRAPVREERRVRPVLAERQGAGRAQGEPGKAHRHRPGVRRRGEDRQPVAPHPAGHGPGDDAVVDQLHHRKPAVRRRFPEILEQRRVPRPRG